MSLSIEQKRAIDVPGIEKELAELWRHEDNAGEAVIRHPGNAVEDGARVRERP